MPLRHFLVEAHLAIGGAAPGEPGHDLANRPEWPCTCARTLEAVHNLQQKLDQQVAPARIPERAAGLLAHSNSLVAALLAVQAPLHVGPPTALAWDVVHAEPAGVVHQVREFDLLGPLRRAAVRGLHLEAGGLVGGGVLSEERVDARGEEINAPPPEELHREGGADGLAQARDLHQGGGLHLRAPLRVGRAAAEGCRHAAPEGPRRPLCGRPHDRHADAPHAAVRSQARLRAALEPEPPKDRAQLRAQDACDALGLRRQPAGGQPSGSPSHATVLRHESVVADPLHQLLREVGARKDLAHHGGRLGRGVLVVAPERPALAARLPHRVPNEAAVSFLLHGVLPREVSVDRAERQHELCGELGRVGVAHQLGQDPGGHVVPRPGGRGERRARLVGGP
mmetsp:Transcript_47978/g.145963  ORF Transcript_47978/g.145963 Transcript_47978/m.145963 type:complete len:395 (-) Transcript_47978:1686-2870(-)